MLQNVSKDAAAKDLLTDVRNLDLAIGVPNFDRGICLLDSSMGRPVSFHFLQVAVFHVCQASAQGGEIAQVAELAQDLTAHFPLASGVVEAMAAKRPLTPADLKMPILKTSVANKTPEFAQLLTQVERFVGTSFAKPQLDDCWICCETVGQAHINDGACFNCIYKANLPTPGKALTNIWKHPMTRQQLGFQMLAAMSISGGASSGLVEEANAEHSMVRRINHLKIAQQAHQLLGDDWYPQIDQGRVKVGPCIRRKDGKRCGKLCIGPDQACGAAGDEDPNFNSICPPCLDEVLEEQRLQQERQDINNVHGLIICPNPDCQLGLTHAGGCAHMGCCRLHGPACQGEGCVDAEGRPHGGYGCGTHFCMLCRGIFSADDIYDHVCFTHGDGYN